MFYKNLLKTKKTKESLFEYDMFKKDQSPNDELLAVCETKNCFNLISGNGALKTGYGFKDLTMPQSEENLNDESLFAVQGTELYRIWKLKWYDQGNDKDIYNLFFYNDENNMCFDELFGQRHAPFVWESSFSEVPYITHFRNEKQDAVLMSGKNGIMELVTSTGRSVKEDMPAIVSCCIHYGKLFAITAEARGTLVYSDSLDIINWTDTATKDLDFNDERGDLNKIISFNDYVYLFRDFGITKLSVYGNNEDFAVSHIYKADGYIYPETIVEYGDNVYFLEGNRLRVFNGLTVKDVPLNCLEYLKGCDNRNANAECFEGKYFLACRGDFNDGQKIGCENQQYTNNLLIIYDIASKQTDVLRGVDIKELLALTNHLKSKLVAIFYNENKARIGELIQNNSFFEQPLSSMWKSGKTNFDKPGERKQIKSFIIKSDYNCKVCFSSEEGEKIYDVQGKDEVQEIQTKAFGKLFDVKICVAEGESANISNFVVRVA